MAPQHHILQLVSLVLASATTAMSMALPLYSAYIRVVPVHVNDTPDVVDMSVPLVLSLVFTIMLAVRGHTTKMYVGSIVCCTLYAYMFFRAAVYRILARRRMYGFSLARDRNAAQCVLSFLSCLAMMTVAIMYTYNGMTLSPFRVIVTVCSTAILYTMLHRGVELIKTWKENGVLTEKERNEFLFAIVLPLALTIPLVTLFSLHGLSSPHVHRLSIALLVFTVALVIVNTERVTDPSQFVLTSTDTWSPDTDYFVFILASILLTSTIIHRHIHRHIHLKRKRM